MTRVNLSLTAIAAAVLATAAFTAPAQAACVTSVWSKTGGNSFASTIRGRDCGAGNLSVRFTGPSGDTGWLSMNSAGANNLNATFVDANITTKVRMKTAGTSMNVMFDHQENSGAVSMTHGSYALVSMQ